MARKRAICCNPQTHNFTKTEQTRHNLDRPTLMYVMFFFKEITGLFFGQKILTEDAVCNAAV